MTAPRFRIRTLVLVVVFVGMTLGLIVLTAENRRLRVIARQEAMVRLRAERAAAVAAARAEQAAAISRDAVRAFAEKSRAAPPEK